MAEEADISFDVGPIFEGVRYTIIPTDDLTEDENQKVRGGAQLLWQQGNHIRFMQANNYYQLFQDMTNNGAEHVSLNLRTNRINDVSKLTHVISTTVDFPDYEDAFLNMVHIVKPTWVDISIMKGKATNPRQFSPDPCLFMSDVVLTCADIPSGDKEAIQGGLLAMGGQHSPHLTKMCTHIIALTLDNDMCQIALKKKLDCKIVLPHW